MTKKIILGCLRVPPVEYHWSTALAPKHNMPATPQNNQTGVAVSYLD
jgi:hypothetical protein